MSTVLAPPAAPLLPLVSSDRDGDPERARRGDRSSHDNNTPGTASTATAPPAAASTAPSTTISTAAEASQGDANGRTRSASDRDQSIENDRDQDKEKRSPHSQKATANPLSNKGKNAAKPPKQPPVAVKTEPASPHIAPAPTPAADPVTNGASGGGSSSSSSNSSNSNSNSTSGGGGRHRPRKLDLSLANKPVPRAPLTSRDGLSVIQDVGLACLSPGFQTQDPTMKEQVQRSMSVRDQQRCIIESRLQRRDDSGGPGGATAGTAGATGAAGSGGAGGVGGGPGSGGKGSKASGKKRPPPGLSIIPPSAAQFTHERVIQSAPLNQTFSGRYGNHPYHHPPYVPHQYDDRHSSYFAPPLPLLKQPPTSRPGALNVTPPQHSHPPHPNAPHIVHTPATQTNNRLPPLADVFSDTPLGRDRDQRSNGGGLFTAGAPNVGPPPPQPQPPLQQQLQQQQQQQPQPQKLPPQQQAQPQQASLAPHAHHLPPSSPSAYHTPIPHQRREYRSAEEAVHDLAGGREELLPRIVHYGGSNSNRSGTPPAAAQQAPTTAPATAATAVAPSDSITHRRRPRAEYEHEHGSPPLGNGPEAARVRTGLGPASQAPEPRQTQQTQGQPQGHGQAQAHEYGVSFGAGFGGAFGAGRESPEIQRRKKEEFLGLCARAWDLFHS